MAVSHAGHAEQAVCLNRHEAAMVAEKDASAKETQLVQQRHEQALLELQVQSD